MAATAVVRFLLKQPRIRDFCSSKGSSFSGTNPTYPAIIPLINVLRRTSGEEIAQGSPVAHLMGGFPRSDEAEDFKPRDYKGGPRRTIWPGPGRLVVLWDQRRLYETLT